MVELQFCEVASDEHLIYKAILTSATGAQLSGMSRCKPASDERAAAAFARVVRLRPSGVWVFARASHSYTIGGARLPFRLRPRSSL